MPKGKASFAAGEINGKVYIAGGEVIGNCVDADEAFVYDTATNAWSQIRSLPARRVSWGGAAINGIFYAVGGHDCLAHRDTLFAYDPVTDTWTTRAPLPIARSNLSVAVVNGILYAVGGESTTAVHAYDPAANTWSTKAPLPVDGCCGTAGSLNGVLYYVGGLSGNTLYAYDPQTNVWDQKASMSLPRQQLGVASANGFLYAISGDGLPANDVVEAYNPATDSWTTVAPIPTWRALHEAVSSNGVIYAIGGTQWQGTLATVEAFAPAIGPTTVVIDIKPGSFPNSINLGSAGSVPVAVLSSATFDATTLDPSTVTLASAPVRLIGKGSRFQCAPQDVNSDGRADLVCHVETAQFMIEEGEGTAELLGKTFSGQQVKGSDSIRIIP